MTNNEKNKMIEAYSNQFKYYLYSKQSEREHLILTGQRDLMKLFFTNHQIKYIENNIRIESEYKRELFRTVESWLQTIKKDIGENPIAFSWTESGLNTVKHNYSWLFTDEKYKGFKLAIELARKSLEN